MEFRSRCIYDYSDRPCPACGKMFKPNRSQARGMAIGRQKLCYCSPACHRKHIPVKQSGKNNPHYKGGVSSSYGYVIVREKGRSPKQPYVGEHILVMEKIIGRRLLPEEVVHHENGNKADNRQENLRLMTRREHMAMHATKMQAERRTKNEYVSSSTAV